MRSSSSAMFPGTAGSVLRSFAYSRWVWLVWVTCRSNPVFSGSRSGEARISAARARSLCRSCTRSPDIEPNRVSCSASAACQARSAVSASRSAETPSRASTGISRISPSFDRILTSRSRGNTRRRLLSPAVLSCRLIINRLRTPLNRPPTIAIPKLLRVWPVMPLRIGVALLHGVVLLHGALLYVEPYTFRSQITGSGRRTRQMPYRPKAVPANPVRAPRSPSVRGPNHISVADLLRGLPGFSSLRGFFGSGTLRRRFRLRVDRTVDIGGICRLRGRRRVRPYPAASQMRRSHGRHGVVRQHRDERAQRDARQLERVAERQGHAADAGDDARRQRHQVHRVGEIDPVLDPDLGAEQADHAVQHHGDAAEHAARRRRDRKSTRLNSSHVANSYAVFCLKKKKK